MIDAFSSDAIPVHLVTREAVAHLRRPSGSPTTASLRSISRTGSWTSSRRWARIAQSLGMVALVQEDHAVTERPRRAEGKRPSTWVLMADGAGDLAACSPATTAGAPPNADPADRVWTGRLLGSHRRASLITA